MTIGACGRTSYEIASLYIERDEWPKNTDCNYCGVSAVKGYSVNTHIWVVVDEQPFAVCVSCIVNLYAGCALCSTEEKWVCHRKGQGIKGANKTPV